MADNYNIWNLYGLQDNPFNTDPLTPYGTELPIDKTFLGRQEEREKLKRIIHSNKTIRIQIYGDIGVGKTSFVNYIKHELRGNYFTPLAELSIQYNWTPEEFMFNTISLLYTTIDRTETIRNKIDGTMLQKWSIIFGTNRGQSESVSGSIGASLGNIGGNLGGGVDRSQSYGVPQLNSTTLKILLQDVLDELLRIGYRGAIIHYNNLELVQDKGEKQLKRIMNGIRGFMQVRGAHFIFVSDRTLYELFQKLQRVEDIFKVSMMLKPFGIEEIKAIIEKRIELLSMPGVKAIRPFDEEALKLLYKVYNGNLRGILRGLECAIIETVQSRPIMINSAIMKTKLFKFAKNKFLSGFTKEDGVTIKILMRILEKRETTNKQIAEHFKMQPQNVSTALTQLRGAGAIRLSREEGRSRYYIPTQEALWLLLEPVPNIEGQILLDFK